MPDNMIERMARAIWPLIPLDGTGGADWYPRKHKCAWDNDGDSTSAREAEKDLCCQIVRAAIEAHKAALEEAGMVIVPREPTEAMLVGAGVMEGYDYDDTKADEHHICWWQAMISASPNEKQPAPP